MEKKMQVLDIMVDLETLGVGANAVIIQLAAIPFNLETGDVFPTEFDKLVNPISCVKSGLKITGTTVEWWMAQEKHVVEKVFAKSILEGLDLKDVMIDFNKFINEQKALYGVKEIRMHENGVLSDGRWLSDAYTATGITPAWKYYEDSDVRTLVDLGKRILGFDPKKDMPFEGDKHVARQDVLHQIKYCCAIYQKMQAAVKAAEPKKRKAKKAPAQAKEDKVVQISKATKTPKATVKKV